MCICSLSYPACKLHPPCYIVICGLLFRCTIFFPHYLINNTIFEKKKLFNKNFVFLFSLQFYLEIILILTRTQRGIIINMHRSSCKVPAVLVIFLIKLNSVDIFSKNTQISDLMKFRPLGAELFHAYRQTDGQT